MTINNVVTGNCVSHLQKFDDWKKVFLNVMVLKFDLETANVHHTP